MPWVKLDDQFADHPKIIQAGPLAGWLWACGIAYANKYLTDGFIPYAQVRRLADVTDYADPYVLAAKLVEVGLWEQVDGGYLVHDFLEYNPSAAQVKADREEAKWRMRRVREQKTNRANRFGECSEEVRANFGECSEEVQAPRTRPVNILTPTTTTAPASENLPVPNPQTGDFFKRIEQAGILVSPIQAEQYEAIIEQAGGDYKLLNEAIDDAVSKGDRPYPDYLKKIIDRCQREGLRPGQWRPKNRDGPKRNNGNGTYTHTVANLPPGFNLEKNE